MPPLYETVLDHVDVLAPEHASLRARIVLEVKRVIAESEYEASWRGDDPKRMRRLAKAKELLALLETRS